MDAGRFIVVVYLFFLIYQRVCLTIHLSAYTTASTQMEGGKVQGKGKRRGYASASIRDHGAPAH